MVGSLAKKEMGLITTEVTIVKFPPVPLGIKNLSYI